MKIVSAWLKGFGNVAMIEFAETHRSFFPFKTNDVFELYIYTEIRQSVTFLVGYNLRTTQDDICLNF